MDLIETIKEKFKMNTDWTMDGTTTLSNADIVLQVIEPHKGTDWKHLVRMDYKKTFDRWSVAWYDKFIENIHDEKETSELFNDIKISIENKDKVVRKIQDYDDHEAFFYEIDDEEMEKLNLSI